MGVDCYCAQLPHHEPLKKHLFRRPTSRRVETIETMISDKSLIHSSSSSFSGPAPFSGSAPPCLAEGTPIAGKRRLCSSLEELERSWEAGPGQDRATLRDRHLNCVASGSDDGDEQCLGFEHDRKKRRRTVASDDDADDEMAEDVGTSVVRFPVRITADRPDGTKDKPGWYLGNVDAQGNRQGRGVTKFDDGTQYEGQYVGDKMEGFGRYTFLVPALEGAVVVPDPSVPGGALRRQQVANAFEGKFSGGRPNGGGMVVTRTVETSSLVRSEVTTYKVGYFRNDSITGEGLRFVYSNTIQGGVSTLERTINRTIGGEVGVMVAPGACRLTFPPLRFWAKLPPSSRSLTHACCRLCRVVLPLFGRQDAFTLVNTHTEGGIFIEIAEKDF